MPFRKIKLDNTRRKSFMLIFLFKHLADRRVHQYQTRLANKISYYLPKARTSYGKFKGGET